MILEIGTLALVLGGASLFAAFPKAYAAVLSALYLPVALMLPDTEVAEGEAL